MKRKSSAAMHARLATEERLNHVPPDDSIEPALTTPRRLAGEIERIAVELARLGLRVRRLGAYLDTTIPLDLSNDVAFVGGRLADLSGAILVGRVAIVAGRDEAAGQERYPLIAAIEAKGNGHTAEPPAREPDLSALQSNGRQKPKAPPIPKGSPGAKLIHALHSNDPALLAEAEAEIRNGHPAGPPKSEEPDEPPMIAHVYPPSHPWYYKLGGLPLKAEAIEPRGVLPTDVEKLLGRLPRDPERRVAKLDGQLSLVRTDIDREIGDYERLADQWPDGRSDEERAAEAASKGGGSETANSYHCALAFAYNAVRYSKGVEAVLESLLAAQTPQDAPPTEPDQTPAPALRSRRRGKAVPS
jgi:hypothetical protein